MLHGLQQLISSIPRPTATRGGLGSIAFATMLIGEIFSDSNAQRWVERARTWPTMQGVVTSASIKKGCTPIFLLPGPIRRWFCGSLLAGLANLIPLESTMAATPASAS